MTAPLSITETARRDELLVRMRRYCNVWLKRQLAATLGRDLADLLTPEDLAVPADTSAATISAERDELDGLLRREGGSFDAAMKEILTKVRHQLSDMAATHPAPGRRQ